MAAMIRDQQGVKAPSHKKPAAKTDPNLKSMQVSLYSPAAGYLDNKSSFGQSKEPKPWTIEVADHKHVRLQNAEGLFLRADGRESSVPEWTD